jgi:hypothetical protein
MREGNRDGKRDSEIYQNCVENEGFVVSECTHHKLIKSTSINFNQYYKDHSPSLSVSN